MDLFSIFICHTATHYTTWEHTIYVILVVVYYTHVHTSRWNKWNKYSTILYIHRLIRTMRDGITVWFVSRFFFIVIFFIFILFLSPLVCHVFVPSLALAVCVRILYSIRIYWLWLWFFNRKTNDSETTYRRFLFYFFYLLISIMWLGKISGICQRAKGNVKSAARAP